MPVQYASGSLANKHLIKTNQSINQKKTINLFIYLYFSICTQYLNLKKIKNFYFAFNFCAFIWLSNYSKFSSLLIAGFQTFFAHQKIPERGPICNPSNVKTVLSRPTLIESNV